MLLLGTKRQDGKAGRNSSIHPNQQLVSKNEVIPASKSYKVFNRSWPWTKPRSCIKLQALPKVPLCPWSSICLSGCSAFLLCIYRKLQFIPTNLYHYLYTCQILLLLKTGNCSKGILEVGRMINHSGIIPVKH